MEGTLQSIGRALHTTMRYTTALYREWDLPRYAGSRRRVQNIVHNSQGNLTTRCSTNWPNTAVWNL